LPSVGILKSLLPELRCELRDAIARPGGQQDEDVTEIGPGLDPVQSAGRNEGDDRGVPLGTVVTADEEPVFAIMWSST
jgi:hypothetical protein